MVEPITKIKVNSMFRHIISLIEMGKFINY